MQAWRVRGRGSAVRCMLAWRVRGRGAVLILTDINPCTTLPTCYQIFRKYDKCNQLHFENMQEHVFPNSKQPCGTPIGRKRLESGLV